MTGYDNNSASITDCYSNSCKIQPLFAAIDGQVPGNSLVQHTRAFSVFLDTTILTLVVNMVVLLRLHSVPFASGT